MLRGLDRLLAAAERVFFVAANGALVAMLAINLVNIASRLLRDQAFIWVFPWTTVLFVWMVFLGFFVLYRRREDVVVDFLHLRMPARIRNAVSIGTNLVVVALMAVILSQLPELLPRQVGNMDYVGLQRYWLAVPFYASCALIAIEFARDAAVRLLGHPSPEGADPSPRDAPR